ncbi:MAG TPA: nuclear transport factor 2 family protein [Gemmatimonadales bacterium]|nr:nuclear transport factor 2 family protein [Gemmatimonadales bacterium]
MPASRRFRFSLLLAAALALVSTSSASGQGVEQPRVPLRTAIKEINTLRSQYMDLYNKKDTAALTAMYLPDAVLIGDDGSTLVGQTAIGKSMQEDAASWSQITLTSDTTRVFGNTAWDVGSMTSARADGTPSVSRYLVVLRRGLQDWKISSVAVVPMTQVAATH